jgi:hypothetical protein
LRSRLFVTRCAIDLSGKEKTGGCFKFKRWTKRAWIEIVIFNRIARLQNRDILKPDD